MTLFSDDVGCGSENDIMSGQVGPTHVCAPRSSDTSDAWNKCAELVCGSAYRPINF